MKCIACNKEFHVGERYYSDYSGGLIHATCCGPEPESYRDSDGEPLKPGDLIPTSLIWVEWDDDEDEKDIKDQCFKK